MNLMAYDVIFEEVCLIRMSGIRLRLGQGR